VPISARLDPGKPVTTPEGFKLAPGFTVEVRNERGLDFDLDLHARFVDGRYVADALMITPGITGERLRKVKVAELVYHGAIAITSGSVLPPSELRQMRPEGPTDRVLEQVARVYRISLVVGYPHPVRDVEHSFGVPRPTASRWVQLARQRGFLRPAKPGRAGERKAKTTRRRG
jgi:hypothetical protein